MVNWGGKTPPAEKSEWEKVEDTRGEAVREEEQDNDPVKEQAVSGEEKALILQEELDRTKSQAEGYYAHLQRLQAEFDNYRKRTQKEKEDFAKYAAERVVEALLPVLDNFERALEAAKATQDMKSFGQGVEMICKQMQNILAKEGLAAIEAIGQPFDPNIHEAVIQVDAAEYPGNTVVEELQKGYYLKEKVIRPSMVKVSR